MKPSFRLCASESSIFAGLSLKSLVSTKPLPEIYKSSKRVKRLYCADVAGFENLFNTFQSEEKLKISRLEGLSTKFIKDGLKRGDLVLFGIKEKDEIVASLLVQYWDFPDFLTEFYLDSKKSRFGQVRRLCAKSGNRDLMKELLSHVFLTLKNNDRNLGGVLAYVTKQHVDLCNEVFPKNSFRRVRGSNFFEKGESLLYLKF